MTPIDHSHMHIQPEHLQKAEPVVNQPPQQSNIQTPQDQTVHGGGGHHHGVGDRVKDEQIQSIQPKHTSMKRSFAHMGHSALVNLNQKKLLEAEAKRITKDKTQLDQLNKKKEKNDERNPRKKKNEE